MLPVAFVSSCQEKQKDNNFSSPKIVVAWFNDEEPKPGQEQDDGIAGRGGEYFRFFQLGCFGIMIIWEIIDSHTRSAMSGFRSFLK